MKQLIFLLTSFLVISIPFAHGQDSNSTLLNIDHLLDDRYSVKSIGPATWAGNESSYFIIESNEIVRYDAESGNRTVVVPEMRLIPPGKNAPVRINSYSFTQNYSHLLIYTNVNSDGMGPASGDYWVLDMLLWTWYKLGGDAPPQSLRDAQFSPDGKKVSYIMDHNIYTENLQSFSISQLTFDGNGKIRNGSGKSAPSSMVNRTINYSRSTLDSGITGHIWNPESNKIMFVQSDWTKVSSFSMINNTQTIYPEVVQFPYVKVGHQLPSHRVGVIDAFGGEIHWLNIPEDPFDSYLMQLEWMPDGEELFMQILNREQNTIMVYIFDLDGNSTKIHTESAENGWIEPYNIYWIENGNRFIFTSEKNGWLQLFLHERNGREVHNITPAHFDIVHIHGIDERNGWIYFIASLENPTQRYLYRVSLDQHQRVEKITPDVFAGTNSYNISGNFQWAMHTHSTFDSPPFHHLISLSDHKVHRVLEDNKELKNELSKIKQGSTDFFRVDIGDGIELDGYIITPPDMDPDKKYPLLYYIYGAPAGQSVLDSWFGRRHLWHLLLAQKKFVVMSIDNRGTPSPRGTQWRQKGYGEWTNLAADDHAAATRQVLESYPFIDKDNIGIYGHSGGGQMSLQLMFRYPEFYHVAAPSAFISHLRFYSAQYQERFMGPPDNNVEGYRKSSAITYAKNLEGKLLIIDGQGDSNVHHQNFQTMVNELVAHGKQFYMMSYPNREHGLGSGLQTVEDKNTQKHLYTLRLNFFLDHLQSDQDK